MEFRTHRPADSAAIQALFVSVFSESEGAREGALIGSLVRELMGGTPARDRMGFVAVDGQRIVGAIFFSRLSFEVDIDVFLLAPVGVRTDYQGRGIGQALIGYGLRQMRGRGVEVVVTYGDPALYAKAGFHPLSEETIAAPFELSQPQGWLGQSLTGAPIAPITGRGVCVKAFDDPVYW